VLSLITGSASIETLSTLSRHQSVILYGSSHMGPREALAQIRALVKQAKTTDDPAQLQRLLSEMEAVVEAAIGRGTLREGRFLQAGHRARAIQATDTPAPQS